MGDVRAQAVDEVKKLNATYARNSGYASAAQDGVGPYTIYSVRFTGERGEHYVNYAIAKKGKVLAAFHHLSEVVRFVDRGLGWRSLLIHQFGQFVGAIVVAMLVAGTLLLLALGKAEQLPDSIWVAVTAGLGYLFGARATLKTSDATGE